MRVDGNGNWYVRPMRPDFSLGPEVKLTLEEPRRGPSRAAVLAAVTLFLLVIVILCVASLSGVPRESEAPLDVSAPVVTEMWESTEAGLGLASSFRFLGTEGRVFECKEVGQAR